MKKTLGLFLFSCCFITLQAQYTIPDPNFAAELRGIVPNAMDGDTLDENHPEVTTRSTLYVSNAEIADLDGLQHFSALTSLECDNNDLTSLPVLPVTLRYLDCGSNSLTTIPDLPPNLENLICGYNELVALPDLPVSLAFLDCYRNSLTALPLLSDSLESLRCYENSLASLPELPQNLYRLHCLGNNLSSLPELPAGLEDLSCGANDLASLPDLPTTITNLVCHDCQLTTLPVLPPSLVSLNCRSNSLGALPELPPSLAELICFDNSLSCLPQLPDALFELRCFDNDINCLPNIPISFDLGQSDLGFPLTVCNVVNTPCPLNREAITGSVFHDDNGNGIKDGGEGPLFLANVEAQPGDYLTIADASGNYVLPIAEGTFTLDGQEVLYHTKTTPPVNVTLGPLEVDSLNHIGYQAIPGIYDLVADFSAQPARPGFDNTLWLQVENIGTESTTASIELNFDPDQTWLGSSETPDIQSGNNASWSPVLAPGESWSAIIALHTDVSVPLGTDIIHTLTSLPQQTDEVPGNNTSIVNTEVVGSYDPNDKLIEPASMTLAELQTGMPIEYTIRFQNTGTFLAERVVITDTLSADLNWSTMDFVSSSHQNTWYIQDGVLHFIFEDIFLPDSNANEPESHGLVQFRMQPTNQLLPGSTIENVANIYFDFNEPVITEPAVFEVEMSISVNENESGGFSLWPNPASATLWLNLTEPTPSNIEVLDLTGKVLVSTESNGANEQALDVGTLNSGLYFVRVTNAEGVRTARFVKI